MKTFFYLLLALIISALIGSCKPSEKSGFKIVSAENILPRPQKVDPRGGVFKIGSKISIVTRWKDSALNNAVELFADILKKSAAVDVRIVEKPLSDKSESVVYINKNNELGDEEYRLSVTSSAVTIEAGGAGGIFYALQTVLQLLPARVFSEQKVNDLILEMPCAVIEDKPAYRWRGFMLDVSRHFFPKEFVFKVLDYLALHKMNRLHLHLTDDQGWRIEIKKYPKLTEIGAWRPDVPWISTDAEKKSVKKNKKLYGGYYTQDDIREIVAYASKRFIVVVPEIEMPGHSISSFAAYPQLSCTGEHYDVPTGGIGRQNRKTYCAGNEEVFTFLENVLTEVIDLFPGEYIHLGGDEVNISSWEKCPKCQRRVKEEGLAGTKELQHYFMNRMASFVVSKGRKVIGWEEIMHGGFPPETAIMAWLDDKSAYTAARAGHDAVFTPSSYFYLNKYQGDPNYEPPAYPRFIPLKKVYSFNPDIRDSLSAQEAEHIFGIEACLWSEYIPTTSNAEYMMFPRLAAVADIAWGGANLKGWEDFSLRLEKETKRYDALAINYSKSFYNVTAFYKVDKKTHSLIVSLENEAENAEIRFTRDGTEPDINSELYTKPFPIDTITVLRAATFRNKIRISRITEIKVPANKATGLPAAIEYPYDERYPAAKEFALTDGKRGSVTYSEGGWQGYFGVDFVGVIDLRQSKNISKITAGFLQSTASGIFFPQSLEYFVSLDGINYKSVAVVKNDIPIKTNKTIIKEFSVSFKRQKARYVKVIAKSIKKCPQWHKYAGVNAFMFIDEILVE